MNDKYFYAVKVLYINRDDDYEECTEYTILTGSCFTEIAAKVEELYGKDTVFSIESHVLDCFFPISKDIFNYLTEDDGNIGLVEYGE